MNLLTYSYPVTLLILCPLVFLAGIVDSIAGGGGIISLPAYIFAGLPIHISYGTNKFVNGCGTLCASVNYLKNGCVNIKAAVSGAGGALLGSAAGAHLALILSPKALHICLLVILPFVALVMICSKKKEYSAVRPELPKNVVLLGTFGAGLVVGCYDGFFGPGTGMFLTLILSSLLRFEIVKASGTTKLINLASNVGSTVMYFSAGKILFLAAVPCLICSVAGNFLGSRLAIKNGAKIIRPIIAVVSVLLIVHVIAKI